jgi:hypothetical protein
MKNFIRISIIFFVVLGIFISCKKENFTDHIGPAICASANFKYVVQPMVSSTSINLNSDTLKLTAAFNEQVPWKIKITGQTSGSFKKFSGYGSSINVYWLGNPDTTVFFQAGEQCTVEFKVACKDPILKSFTITAVNSFKNLNYLVYDADGNGLALGPYAYGTYATHTVTSSLTSPQGGSCYCTDGNSGATPVWFFGGYDLNVTLGSSVKTDPSKVYFNCFVNVQGSQATVPVITLKEGTVLRSLTLNIHGNGWYYVNVPLTSFNIVNPRNINTVIFGLNSYPVQATAGKMCVDFVTFTNDAPFINTVSN